MTPRLSAAQRRAVTGSDPATGRLSAGARVCAALVSAGLAVPHGRGGHHSHYLTREGLLLRAELARQDAAGPAAGSGTLEEGAEGAGAAGAGGAGSGAPTGSFTADDGTGAAAEPHDPARRTADVASAWAGLLQIRAVLGDGTSLLPAPWERERPVHAVSLALEAAGCPPARPPAPAAAPSPAPADSAPVPDQDPDRQAGPAPDRTPRSEAAATADTAADADDTADAVPRPGRPGYRVTPSAHPGLAEVSWSGPRPGDALAKCARLLPALGWQATAHRTRSGEPYLLVSPAGRVR